MKAHITGTLQIPRIKAVKLLESRGFTICKFLTECDFLIVGREYGTKVDKALALNIECVSLNEALKKVG